MQERWAEIQTIWKSNQVLYIIVGFFAGLMFFPILQSLSQDASAFLSNLVPEGISVAFTVLLIDRLYERRERGREKQELKAHLIGQLNSRINQTTIVAAEELDRHGWLKDGTLRKQTFDGGNWRNMSTSVAGGRDRWEAVDFQGSFFFHVDFENSALLGGSFQDAHLRYCNFRNAALDLARFQNAVLFEVNLEGASLNSTKFQGADLRGSNLKDAKDLKYAGFDMSTILPDGTRWTPDTDITRFTDPRHSDFWESGWVKRQRERGGHQK